MFTDEFGGGLQEIHSFPLFHAISEKSRQWSMSSEFDLSAFLPPIADSGSLFFEFIFADNFLRKDLFCPGEKE